MKRVFVLRIWQSIFAIWLFCFVCVAGGVAQYDAIRLANQHESSNEPPAWRSPFLAFAMSAVATGVPVALGFTRTETNQETLSGILVLGGLTLGPAVGYCYGGLWGRGLVWAGVRGGIIGLTLLAMTSTAETGWWSSIGAVYAIGVIGLVAAGVDALYDVLAVGPSVSERNMQRNVFGMTVSPTYSNVTKGFGVKVRVLL